MIAEFMNEGMDGWMDGLTCTKRSYEDNRRKSMGGQPSKSLATCGGQEKRKEKFT
jgi:hypothetical protein